MIILWGKKKLKINEKEPIIKSLVFFSRIARTKKYKPQRAIKRETITSLVARLILRCHGLTASRKLAKIANFLLLEIRLAKRNKGRTVKAPKSAAGSLTANSFLPKTAIEGMVT